MGWDIGTPNSKACLHQGQTIEFKVAYEPVHKFQIFCGADVLLQTDPRNTGTLLQWMEEILDQLIDGLSHYS